MRDTFFHAVNVSYLNNGPYSIFLHENEIAGLTGSSGIGKTQLLRAMVEAIVSTGEFFLEGVSSLNYSSPQWRKKVSLVPAEAVWWHDIVGEHFPISTANNQELVQSIQQLGFEREVLSWKVSRLSTGERQRLALIRALAQQPNVLLLDEPCSALDDTSTRKVEDLLATYVAMPKRAIIWVSHDLEQLKRVSDSCYVLERSRLLKMWPT